MAHLTLSIDLDAELSKITQRQHLNDVHYVVQLVRHALAHNPKEIRIVSRKDGLWITQNGAPFNSEELSLLQQILAEDNPVPARQHALDRLEKEMGIGMLSLLRNNTRVTIDSGGRIYQADQGRLNIYQSEPAQGYVIHIIRNLANPETELRELTFFCSGAKTRILFNEKEINSAIKFEDQMFTCQFKDEKGEGMVGIPEKGEVCVLRYYKNGVRVGIRQFLPDDGFVYHGYFNATDPKFEPNYKDTINHGEVLMEENAIALYRSLRSYFTQFAGERADRLKKVLLGLDQDFWYEHLESMPAFHSNRETFVLTLNHLLKLVGRFGFIIYTVRPDAAAPPYVPCLTPEDVAFLQRELELPLHLLQLRSKKRWPKRKDPGQVTEVVPATLEEPARRLLEELNRERSFERFLYIRERSRIGEDTFGFKTIYLQVHHNFVEQAAESLRKGLVDISVLRYQLMAIAK